MMCYYLNVQFQGQRVNIPVSSKEKSLRTYDSDVFLLGLKSSGPICEREGDRSEFTINGGFLEHIKSTNSSNMYLRNQIPAGCNRLVQDQRPNRAYVRS